jgi:hypothetical protein
MLERFEKLRGRSINEFSARGTAGFQALLERLGASARATLPSSARLFKEFGVAGAGQEDALLEHFRNRKSVSFYHGFSDLDSTTSVIGSRFPTFLQWSVDQADQICEGNFDLLGYKKLYYGSTVPEWDLDPLSGLRLPQLHWSRIDLENWGEKVDLKVIWELNRHQYFSILGQAYLFTKKEKYAHAFVDHLEDWFESNRPKNGINWASSLEIAFRAISWIWAFYFFKDSNAFTPELLIRMLKYLYLHGRHLETYLSTYSSPNTHLTGEALGLYYLGRFLPEIKESAGWKNLGHRVLIDALHFQVRSDGTYCEQSDHYHRYTTDFYSNLHILRQLDNEPIEYKHLESLNKLFDVLLFATQPNGEMPLLGDDDGGRLAMLDNRPVANVRGLLALGAVMLDRNDLKFAPTDATAEIVWLLGAEGLARFDSLTASQPEATSKAFKEGGLYVMRDTWKEDGTFLLIDCGEHGFLNGGHAHADALGFVLSFNGRPVFVDSGTYKYASAPEERKVFRSTGAHNCLTVNGESSSLIDGPWSWAATATCKEIEWRIEKDSAYFRGTHDGFERLGVKYDREIALRYDTYVTVTEFLMGDSQNYYQLHFILSPHLSAAVDGGGVVITGNRQKEKAEGLTIVTEVDADCGADPVWKIQKWYISPCYGSKVETTKLVLSVKAQGRLVISNTISKI